MTGCNLRFRGLAIKRSACSIAITITGTENKATKMAASLFCVYLVELLRCSSYPELVRYQLFRLLR